MAWCGEGEGKGEGDSCALVFSGNLDSDAGDIFTRPNVIEPQKGFVCGVAASSSLRMVPYKAFEFTSPSTASFLEVGFTSGNYDAYILLYCGTFDPEMPTENIVADDDDGGASQLSQFFAADEVGLLPDSKRSLTAGFERWACDIFLFGIVLTSLLIHASFRVRRIP